MSERPSRTNVRRMIGIVSLIVVAGIIGLVCWRVDDWSRDWTTNSASQSYEKPGLSAPEAVQRIQRWVVNRSNWSVAAESATGSEAKLHLTRSTPVLKFTDDVHVTIRSRGQGVMIEATSKSRIGKGDLGQNPRNLAELVNAFE